MKLNNPITINFKPITLPDNTVRTVPPLTLTEINYLLIDNVNVKRAMIQISYVPQPLILWEGTDYDDIGDYTQQQIEDRIVEILGDNPEEVLSDLFFPKSH